jgi:hypothetical protein
MFEHSIKGLPAKIEQDDPQGGVLRPWVRDLPLRLQGVIITAMRGCDLVQKEDASKDLSRMIRRATLNPYDPRESEFSKGFFGFNAIFLAINLRDFLHSMDQYPLHYVMHLMHTAEIIGYEHPEEAFRVFFNEVYRAIVHKLHLEPESRMAMIVRLTEDRVEKGTVEA